MTITYIETEQGTVQVDQISKPDDRKFRSAWILDGPVIKVDMDKAREIWRDNIRQVREPKFKELDAAFMKAMEQADTVKQQKIATQKQVLRDATADPAIDAAQSVEALKLVQPNGLVVS